MAALSAFLLACLTAQSAPPTKIQVGDKLSVVVAEDENLSGEYTVLDDGSITGVGFGRIVVAGKSVEEARILIRNGLKKVLKAPTVSLVVKEQKKRYVFVTSLTGSAPGPVDYQDGLDVRRVLTGIVMPGESDQYEVRLFRGGQLAGQDFLDQILIGSGEFGSTKLKPDDVVTLAEVTKVRIYVSGKVKAPGEFRIRQGTDALQAVALAGGTDEASVGEVVTQLLVRRGTTLYEVEPGNRFLLEAGDTVVVAVPEQIKVSVGGEVQTPGLWAVRKGTGLLAAIQRSGGLGEEGSLRDVLVIRKGEAYLIDLSPAQDGKPVNPFEVEDGDTVYVQRNESRLTVLGFVKEPKTFTMKEGREYRLAEAVSEGGGPDARGSYHRVYLGRKDESGKVQVAEYRLDAFLKDGDISQNPVLMPGDVVMVGEPKGFKLADVTTVLSNALLINTLFKK